MVIDKTTGRGCAWSIASKTVVKRLIADGIVGKPIFRKQAKRTYRLLLVEKLGDGRLYVTQTRGSELADELLWTPSFIEAKIWEQGVSKFRTSENLENNVEAYLLPEMVKYLQSIPELELVSMTRDFLIEHGIINKPICQRAGNTYYFNENEIYSVDKKSQLFSYENRIKFNIFNAEHDTCINMNVWRKASSQFKVGMTLKECIGIFLKTKLVHRVPQEQSPIDRLIQSIAPPIFERVPGNEDENTFDHIRMTVGLPRYQFNSWEALQNEVKKYQKEIRQRVAQRLEKDRQFEKYGIPLNFLKVSDVILRRDFSMEFIFELKVTSPQNIEN